MDKKRKDILLSLIIPFYNSENTLKNCIYSILAQKKNENIEIILINDGSTDNSLKIAKKVKKDYSNIILINNHYNLGVSASRNIGLKKAKGKFIIFLDSDDEILKDSLFKIKKLISKDKKNDFIFFNKFISKVGKNTYFSHLLVKENLKQNNINKLILNFIKQKNIYGNIYNYILSRNFLLNKKIYFSKNINFAEDQEFVVKIICFSKKFQFINDSFYIYNSGHGNLSNAMGIIPTKSCIKTIFNLIVLKSKLRNKIRQKYIETINSKIIKQFIPRLLCLSAKDILIISKYLKANKKILNKLDFFFGNERIYFNKKIFRYKEYLTNIKKKVSNDMVKNLPLRENIKFFSFCYNYYSLAYEKILREKKLNFIGHLDNNYRLFNKIKIKKKIIPPQSLKKKDKAYKKNIVIIITNQFRKNINNITNQLVKFGIPKKQVLYKIF